MRKITKTCQLICILMLCALWGNQSIAQIKTYRQLPELLPSAIFKVEIAQGGSFSEIHTYQHSPNGDASKTVTQKEHWTSFGFDNTGGAITIRVSLKDGTDLTDSNSEMVNKMHTDVSVTFNNGAMLISSASPKKQLLVRKKDNKGQPLMVFIDPFADSAIPPGAKVVTFAAQNSVHEITNANDRYTVPNDVDIVIIEDGALVKGTIHTDTGRNKPFKLMGRGVLMGNGPVVHGSTGLPYNALNLKQGDHNVIENIIVINSRHFGLDIGKYGTVDNVKLFGYDTNNDGIVAKDNSTISNTFLKVNDDHIKAYYDGLKVRNCTFYAQWNGGIIQNGWNKIGCAKNVLFENCEVVECEFTYCGDPKLGQGGYARSFVSLREQEAPAYGLNHTYKNFIIQGQLERFIGINGKYDSSTGCSLEDIKLENITVINEPRKDSYIYCESGFKMSLSFCKVTFNGRDIQSSDFIQEGDVDLSFDACTNTSIMNPAFRHKAQIFPNPTNNFFSVDMEKHDGSSSISLYNINGALVLQQDDLTNKKIDIRHLPNGIYMAVIQGENWKEQIKMVVSQ